ncbi:FKBP-type peptidyl-prolyl cis-trans isomerase [Microbacterium sp. zg.B48]|uniref:FKBP-type peptidyl-prolyl cis-trans isomerase n=1 Tax=unclassified Microbacterium TaxID=2609290 RepID=UPI00214AED6A|nr:MULTISPECIES: FKBP-type peptidyl-prolyl cis-trans isomerase [unclassified Microbacterium]MCR2764750.1 FKBP-type peptidyl-prolyl cis-trans isomerase [Microbacterium sp. zg.B48]MCR2810112.1 FKBP-type peptidyl-prolyl cis-trans isomerase [Microbacterium sp. zg.B185]WIM20051.1 FKBP-type peptidyl-prolyl cis-trans isomerase [Microbacterium sp. zg-B185]
MRIRPLAALSVAALSALLLAGCASGTPDDSASPSASVVDLCEAKAPSGAAAEAVTVEGAAGEEAAATFDFPLEIPELQSTVIEEGSGDPVEAGQLVRFALTGFSAETGENIGAIGYGETPLLPAQISPDNPIGQILGCATPGTRVVATFPPSDPNAGEVYVFDFLDVVPTAAWGEPQEPVEGMPVVTLDDDGAPTVELPDGDAPTEVELETLKKGDGPTVLSGDTVLVQYSGVKWSDGTVFDSSWEAGAPTSFQTTGVVDGFRQALEGQTVGSQVVAVIPPAFGYGEGEINDADLKGETLVFVVDILGLEHAPVAAQ